MKDTMVSAATVIEANELSLIFDTNDGPVHALKDVNLTIAKGEFVSFIGPSWLWQNDISAGDCGFGNIRRGAR